MLRKSRELQYDAPTKKKKSWCENMLHTKSIGIHRPREFLSLRRRQNMMKRNEGSTTVLRYLSIQSSTDASFFFSRFRKSSLNLPPQALVKECTYMWKSVCTREILYIHVKECIHKPCFTGWNVTSTSFFFLMWWKEESTIYNLYLYLCQSNLRQTFVGMFYMYIQI